MIDCTGVQSSFYFIGCIELKLTLPPSSSTETRLKNIYWKYSKKTIQDTKPAGVSAVTRSSVDAPNREQRYLIVFILYDH